MLSAQSRIKYLECSIMTSADIGKWHLRYIRLAQHVSEWSKDPSTKVGAVAVGQHGQILSQGYNGFPRGVDDLESRLLDREMKYKYVIHAEMNCIYNASLSGVSLNGASMYVYGLPMCHDCAKGVIQSGIREVHCAHDLPILEKWSDSWNVSSNMFQEAGVYFATYSLDQLK